MDRHEKFLCCEKVVRLRAITLSISDPSAFGNIADVVAELKPDDTVRLVSDNGFVWK